MALSMNAHCEDLTICAQLDFALVALQCFDKALTLIGPSMLDHLGNLKPDLPPRHQINWRHFVLLHHAGRTGVTMAAHMSSYEVALLLEPRRTVVYCFM